MLLLAHQEYVYYRLRNTTDDNHQFVKWFELVINIYRLLSHFQGTLDGMNTNTILCIWNPLQSDIVSFGVDENLQLTIPSLDLNYYNEESSINTTNQNILGYIQPDYLESVNNDVSLTSRDAFLALMTFNSHKNRIGFRILNHCIQNDISPLRVYFDSAGNWTNFGTFNIAENNLSYPTCFIEQISYLRFDALTKRYHKSSESAEYCPPQTYNIGFYKINFEITPMYARAYPTSIYFDDELNIISAFCGYGNLSFYRDSLNVSNISFAKTDQALLIYKKLIN